MSEQHSVPLSPPPAGVPLPLVSAAPPPPVVFSPPLWEQYSLITLHAATMINKHTYTDQNKKWIPQNQSENSSLQANENLWLH